MKEASRAWTVVVNRLYAAPIETIFRAFTEPHHIVSWLSPSDDIATEVIEWDLRPGGAYRLGFRFPDGLRNSVIGRFQEISCPEKLVFTWTWEAPDPHAGIDTLVTVQLARRGEETEVTVTHERFPDEETRDRHDEGWNGALARLAAWLDNADSNPGARRQQ